MSDIPVNIDIELLQPGDEAPDFTLPGHSGQNYTLSAYRGTWVILWWYIQAMGAGCASCARAFANESGRIDSLRANLLGLSYASPEMNQRFAKEVGFKYPLLTADETLAEAYGAKRSEQEAWSGLPRRLAYIINPEGVVEERYVIASSSHKAITDVVDDLEQHVVARMDPQEPTFGKQPHQMNAVERAVRVLRRTFTSE